MGLTAHSISCGANKEVEVCASIGLLDVVYIEALPIITDRWMLSG
jgi:hypothetical protein